MNHNWRILMLVHNAVGIGTYWRAFHFGRHLAQRGHHVTLMAMAARRRLGVRTWSEQGLTIVETPDLLWGPLRSGWDLWEAGRRLHWLRGREFDLVHAFEARPVVLLPMLYLRWVRKTPLVMDWCDWFGRGGAVEERSNPLLRAALRPIETFFEERFRTRADGTTVICTALLEKAQRLGVPPETIVKLRDGADVQGVRPLDRIESRRALGLDLDAPIIGYVGTIFQRDAHLMALAFNRIHAALPSARLLLIGYFNRPVEQMLDAPGAVIRSGVIQYGALSTYLAACDLCWLPYCDTGANRGRWPLKFNDYLAAGRATVGTAVGDVTEVMRAYAVGRLAQDTPDDLARQVLVLLADPAECARLGMEARRVAETVFDWRLGTQSLEKLYAKVLSNSAHLTL